MTSAPNFTASAVIRRHPDQVAAEIAGEVVVMSITQGKYVGFDDIASAVWRHMEQPQPLGRLCALLAQDFDGDPDTMQADVVEFLHEMNELGLVIIEPDATAVTSTTAAV